MPYVTTPLTLASASRVSSTVDRLTKTIETIAMQVDSESPLSYLERQEAGASEQLRPWWSKLRTAYERKLWHNVTVVLSEFVQIPESGPVQVELFEKFIKTIENKINALKLVEIARRIGREFSEPDLTLSFLESVHSRLAKPVPTPATETTPEIPAPPKPAAEAYALSLSSIAYAKLLLGDLDGCKKAMDECEAILNSCDGVEGVVNAGFYGVASDYYKVKADYAPYYKNSLLYLACVNLETDLTRSDRIARAHDLCIAALLSEAIYNFGELLLHPILADLAGTEHEWIQQLVGYFNQGDLGKYESESVKFSKEPILEQNAEFLKQKICLMALIQTAFARPRDGSSRLMSFKSISEATRLPEYEVEHLIMKALSLSLIRGSLDQVDGVADIQWVQPRVLAASQLETLSTQIGQWSDTVGTTGSSVDQFQKAAAY